MHKNAVIVTGAAGFIGSSIVAALSNDYEIVALDKRVPGESLVSTAPSVRWLQIDIGDAAAVTQAFRYTQEHFGQVDFVIHLAAYYHFGNDWRPEYEESNIHGTENIIQAAIAGGARRLIFASSIAAMEPAPLDQPLTENSATSDYLPYARSKSLGEEIVKRFADQLPGIVLRIGGVFSDWCELPPLFSLLRLWTAPLPFRATMPGKGKSGLPYIHLSDVVNVVKSCLANEHHLDSHEVFLASQHGTVFHQDIYRAVLDPLSQKKGRLQPIRIPASVARSALTAKVLLEKALQKPSYQHPWMIDFIDRPWVVDTTGTREKLGWQCTPGMGVLDRLPVILHHYRTRRRDWMARNNRRNTAQYEYLG